VDQNDSFYDVVELFSEKKISAPPLWTAASPWAW